jgi:hypothetical protein
VDVGIRVEECVPHGQILDAGEIVEAEPPRRLVIRWQNQFKPELKAEGESLCTIELEPSGTAVKLSITHTIEREPSKFIEAVSGGWPKVISNLKSLLETGSAVLQEPYPAVPPPDSSSLLPVYRRLSAEWLRFMPGALRLKRRRSLVSVVAVTPRGLASQNARPH